MDFEVRTVKSFRLEQNMTLKELATLTGITVKVLSMIDRNHYRASLVQVKLIAIALDVNPCNLDIGSPETAPGTWGSGTPRMTEY